MKYSEYRAEALRQMPYMTRMEFTKISLIRQMAEHLFLKGDVMSDIAQETRKQIIGLQKTGILSFEKE